MAYDNAVHVDVTLTLDQMKKKLKEAERDVTRLSERLNSISKGEVVPKSLSVMQKELAATEREIKAVENENKNLIESFKKEYANLADLRKMGFKDDQLKSQIADVDRLAERLRPVGAEVRKIRDRAAELQLTMEAVRLNPMLSDEAKALSNEIAEAQSRVSHYSERIEGFENAEKGAERATVNIREIGEAAQSAAKFSVAAFKKVGSILGAVVEGAGRIVKFFANIGKSLIGIGKNSRRAGNGMQSLWSRLRSIVLGAAVFNVISAGLTELRKQLGAVLMANEQFAASWNAIRVNLLTAFSPLWEVVEPALLTFMDLLARFTSMLAQFMALLFGRTYQQAKDSAAAINAEADAVDNLGAAAKKNEKFLASFDEINKASSAESGGGGASSGLDFTAVDNPPALPEWLNELSEKLKEIFTIADPEYWFNLGEKLANWITSGLNAIPWPAIQEAAKNLAINFASFLGGFLTNEEMWTAIGHTIAQGLNTVLIFAYNFLTTFPFEQFGQAVGAGLNTLFDEVPWALLGSTFAAYLTGIFDFGYNALVTTDWTKFGNGIGNTVTSFFKGIDEKKIGATLGEVVNSAFEWLSGFIQGTDPKEIATDISGAINGFFSTVNWSDMASTVSDGALDALEGIALAVEETDWVAIGEDIRIFLEGIDWDGIADKLGVVVGEAFKAIGGIVLGVIAPDLNEDGERSAGEFFKGMMDISKWPAQVSAAFAGGIAKAFGADSETAEAIKNVGETMVRGFLGTLNPILLIANIKDVFGAVKDNLPDVGGGLADTFKNIGQTIADAWNGIIDFFKGVPAQIGTVVDAIGKWFYELPGKIGYALGYALGSVVKWAQDVWNTISTEVPKIVAAVGQWFYELPGKIWTAITGAVSKIATWGSDMIAKIKETVPKVIDSIIEFFKGIPDKLKNLGQDIWQGLIDGITSAWNTFTSSIKAFIDKFVQGFKDALGIHSPSTVFYGIGENIVQGLLDGIDALIGNVVTFFKTAWADIQLVWSTVSSWFEVHIGKPVSDMFNSALKAIAEFFSSAWNNIKNVWNIVAGWFNTYIITPVRNAFDAFLKAIYEFFSKAWTNIKAVWTAVKGWFDTYVITPMRNAFNTALTAIKDFFGSAWTKIKEIWTAVKSWFETNVINPLRTAFETVWTAIKGFFESAWTKIKETWSTVKAWFDEKVINPAKDAFDTALSKIKGFFEKLWSDIKSVWDTVSQWFKDKVTGPIEDAFDTIIKNITGWWQALEKTVKGIWEKLTGWIGDLLGGLSDVDDAASNAGKNSRSIITTRSIALNAIEIPKLARGGIVDSATIAMIGEKGRKAVVPLENSDFIETLADMIGDRVSRALTDSMSALTAGAAKPVTLELDRRVIGNVLLPILEDADERRGVRVSSRMMLGRA